MSKNSLRLCVVGLLLLAGALLLPAPFLTASQYGALAAGTQAFGVVVALGLAALALYSDNRDRRVDRVLDLHAELAQREFRDARRRLRRHLRHHGSDGHVRRTTRHALRHDPELSTYGGQHQDESPNDDAGQVLRYFERANAARLTGSVHEQLFHELIGRHAVWWFEVFRDDEGGAPLDGLLELGKWANEYPSSRRMYPNGWGKNRARDFVKDKVEKVPAP